MLPAQNMLEGHEYVDLGLTTKGDKPIYWATCNVGAEQPEESGAYFFWGDPMGFVYTALFEWVSYKWYDEATMGLTKYCYISDYGNDDNKKVLEPDDDAAHMKWGGAWRMPTASELNALVTKCSWTWGELNGVNGYVVTGKNGNSIFLPAAGYRTGVYQYETNNAGGYWTSSLSMDSDPNNAIYLFFVQDRVCRMNVERCVGLTVRAVCIAE